jgi:VWFA-related protein
VSIADEDAPPASGMELAPIELPPPFATNMSVVMGRAILIIIDQDSIRTGRERPTIEAAKKFLDNLTLRDEVAYMLVPNGGIDVDFTRDHAKVRDAIGRFVGRAPRETTERDDACRSRNVLQALRDSLDSLSISESPRTVVFVSSSLLQPRRDAPNTSAPGPCEIHNAHYQEVQTAASIARAHFYIIQPDDLKIDSLYADEVTHTLGDPTASRFARTDEGRAGLESLAGTLGGEMFHLTADKGDMVFGRIARESSSYYVIGFMPEPNERTGLTHRVDLRVTRESTDRVRLRSRTEVVIPKADVGSTGSPKEMLQNGQRYRGLPLRLNAFALQQPEDQRLKIVTVMESADPSVSLTSAIFGCRRGKQGAVEGRGPVQGPRTGLPLTEKPPNNSYRLPLVLFLVWALAFMLALV